MTTLLTRWVWVERVMVLLANIGVNLGIATTTQESTVAAGGVIGLVVFVQIVLAAVSHWRTLEATIRADIAAILSTLISDAPPSPPVPTPVPDAATVARHAGKAVTP